MIVFIIGKIGSGKSTFAELLSLYEQTNIIDADSVSRKVLKNKVIKMKLLEAFGELDIIDEEISPASLAEKAFRDEASVRELNRIMHPEIIRQIKKNIQKGMINIIDLPLPDAVSDEIKADKTVLITCDDKIIKERCEVPEKLKRQRFIRLPENADFIISNDGSYEDLSNNAEKVFNRLLI